LATSGVITKINEELRYGFVKVKEGEDVFFSDKTDYLEIGFERLKINDKVRVSVESTDRGPFAKSLEVVPVARKIRPDPSPEASI